MLKIKRLQDFRNYNKYQSMNEKQKKAFEAMVNGKNVFITGVAGTGKSYVLNAFNEWARGDDRNRIVTVAPTGLSAYLVKGVTLHSQFKLGGVIPKNFNYFKYLNGLPVSKRDVIQSMDLLEIEEISMVRYDYFRRIMQIVEAEELEQGHKIQVILSGDFGQLCPILTSNTGSKKVSDKYSSELEVFRNYYPQINPEAWAFLDEEHWNKFEVHELTEVVRQQDKDFVEALNKVRVGDKSGLDFINKNKANQAEDDAVIICGTNAQVQKINDYFLSKLEGKSASFKLKYSGETDASAVPADPVLTIKKGAKVMCLINDSDGDTFEEKRYHNGSFGEVIDFSIDDSTGELTEVTVDFSKNNEVIIVTFKPHVWKIKAYLPIIKEDEEIKRALELIGKNNEEVTKENITFSYEEVGTIMGFPLRLAYAMTVHKAQGHTFEHIGLMPKFWENGQLYTALSRVTSIKGFCSEYINPTLIKSSKLVKNFYENLHLSKEELKNKRKKAFKNFDLSGLILPK